MEHLNPVPSSAEALRFYPAGASVAVLTAEGLDRLLDYRAPAGGVRAGDLVEVPLGPRRVLGMVWGDGQGDVAEEKLREVVRVLDAPPFPAAMRGFLARAADYTLTPLSIMLRLATRAPGLGAPPAARPILRLTGAQPERMTPARARVLAAFAEYGNLGFAPTELAQLAGVSPGVVAGLEAQGVLEREAAVAGRALSAPRSRRRRRGRCPTPRPRPRRGSAARWPPGATRRRC